MDSIRKISRRQALLSMGATLGVSFASRPWLTPGIAEAVGKSDFSEIDRRLKETIDTGVFEGIGLLLCTSDKTLYKKAFGADTTETTHLLASATKLASATTVMTLVHDKLIKLDDPIKKYLPQFGPVRGKITIRQLLAQTHGMAAGHPSIPAPQQDNGITLEESVNQIAKDDSVQFPTGSKQEYQPAVSYHIMGRIAEVVTRQDWATLFEKRVAGPLEMKTFSYGKTKNPRIGGGAKCALQDYGNEEQSFIAAYDARTGKEIWRVPREPETNYSTPFVWQTEARAEIVAPATKRTIGYGLDGKELWSFTGGMSKLTFCTPFAANGLLYVGSGYFQDSVRGLFAIKSGVKGGHHLACRRDEQRRHRVGKPESRALQPLAARLRR
ncbi:MAG: serine hydrolase [Blastocatellia bacterium]